MQYFFQNVYGLFIVNFKFQLCYKLGEFHLLTKGRLYNVVPLSNKDYLLGLHRLIVKRLKKH